MSIDNFLRARERDFSSARFKVLGACTLAEDLNLNLRDPALAATAEFTTPTRTAGVLNNRPVTGPHLKPA